MNIAVGQNDLLLISSMIVLFLVSLVPITAKVLRGNREQNPLATLTQGLIGIVAAVFLLIVFSRNGRTAFHEGLLFDGITLWMGSIAILSCGAAMVMMYENPATKGRQFSELIFLTMSSALGM